MKKILSMLTVFFALAAVFATFAACKTDKPKTQLETPTIASQVYTGSKLTAVVPQRWLRDCFQRRRYGCRRIRRCTETVR